MRSKNALFIGLAALFISLTLNLYPFDIVRKEVRVFGTFEDFIQNKPLKVYQTESAYSSDKKIKSNHSFIKVVEEKTADGRTIGTAFLIPPVHHQKYLRLNEYGYKEASTTKKMVATYETLNNLFRRRALETYKSEHCEADAYNDTILIFKHKPNLIRVTYYYNQHSNHTYQEVYSMPKALLDNYLQKKVSDGAISSKQAEQLRRKDGKYITLKYDYQHKYIDETRERAIEAKYSREALTRESSAAATESRQATTYNLHRDTQRSIVAVTDQDGKLIERVTYTVYGVPTFWDYTQAPNNPIKRSRSVIGNEILFQGRRYDYETGLYYFRNRYYDPTIGRFLQVDPLGYKDSMNLYQAFNNNPINFTDPMGQTFSQDFVNTFVQPKMLRTYQERHGLQQGTYLFTRNLFRQQEDMIEGPLLYSAWWLDKYSGWVPGLNAGVKIGTAINGTTVSGHRLTPHERRVRALWAELELLTLYSGPLLESGVKTPTGPVIRKTVNNADDFVVQASSNEYSLYYKKLYGGEQKGIAASIDSDGIVTTMIDAGTNSPMRGTEMMKRAVEHFGERVKGIAGSWTYGDNLAKVNELTKKGVSLLDAVKATWTGKRAASYGFRNVIINTVKGKSGEYKTIYVDFVK